LDLGQYLIHFMHSGLDALELCHRWLNELIANASVLCVRPVEAESLPLKKERSEFFSDD